MLTNDAFVVVTGGNGVGGERGHQVWPDHDWGNKPAGVSSRHHQVMHQIKMSI